MSESKVKWVEIDEQRAGQRIDNYLLAYFGDVPKSRIYRALRNGEVRVNKGRVKPVYRVQMGDQVRIPPLYAQAKRANDQAPDKQCEQLENQILYEDDHLIALNKPAGLAAHSGTGERFGVIEVMRSSRKKQPFLELAHRLDKETSGCLLLAKSRPALLDIQKAIQSDHSSKQYLLFTKGRWQVRDLSVQHALKKSSSESIGQKMRVDKSGQAAHTIFSTLAVTPHGSLMSAVLLTGRTHQIRVHAQQEQHPVAGDRRYGDFEYNRSLQKEGLQRMFLHAEKLSIVLETLERDYNFAASLPDDLQAFTERSKQ